jgi:hypothetical protein
MDERVKEVVREAIIKLINETASELAIGKSLNTHSAKIHFVPASYRVLGGLLQALNIKFGNFIETLIALVVQEDNQVTALPSSGRNVDLSMTAQTDALIDAYITSRQIADSEDQPDSSFAELIQEVFHNERRTSQPKQIVRKDVDALFQTSEGRIIYLEIKFNDDHDTGKFVDINRKLLKTYAGLLNALAIDDENKLFPVLYYFNPTKCWGNIYLPSKHIYRGKQLFDEFFEMDFEQLQVYLYSISTDQEIIAIFDALYKRIRNR